MIFCQMAEMEVNQNILAYLVLHAEDFVLKILSVGGH